MRLALVILGVLLVVAITAAVEFVALLWHRNLYWVAVPLATVVLYLIAWRRDPPLSSNLPRGLIAFVGAALGFEMLVLGLPLLAVGYVVVGAGVVGGGSLILSRLRTVLDQPLSS